jgi:hypothetical protein
MIEQVMEFAGVNNLQASLALAGNGWNVENAVSAYLNNPGGYQSSNNAPSATSSTNQMALPASDAQGGGNVQNMT